MASHLPARRSSTPPVITATGRPLSVDVDLDLTVDGHPMAVRGEGRRVVVSVDEPRTAWRLFRSRRPPTELVRTVSETLDALGLDVELEVAGHSVGVAGRSAVPSRLTRAMGLRSVQLNAPRLLPPGAFDEPLGWAVVAGALTGGIVAGTLLGRR